ncbi:unnamed protein product, partial [marine sediment metagenome]
GDIAFASFAVQSPESKVQSPKPKATMAELAASAKMDSRSRPLTD